MFRIILLVLVIALLFMSKKTCKTIKGKRRCTNLKPQMNARDIIKIQLNSMKNNKNDSGIKDAFKYASKENKKQTGPYSSFKRMLQNKTYKHLLNNKSWKIVPKTIQKIKDEIYSVLVEVLSSIDNQKHRYRFTLSRQIPSLFWRTDSVIKETYPLEIQQNIFGNPLEICSTDPMTGWKRDGRCNTHENDRGTHTVCAELTDEFLDYTKTMGNDLSTPRGSFPGLKKGDRWCLCANRWLEAHRAGKAPKVIKESTHKKTHQYVDKDILAQYFTF